jgi:hypothetical protein
MLKGHNARFDHEAETFDQGVGKDHFQSVGRRYYISEFALVKDEHRKTHVVDSWRCP